MKKTTKDFWLIQILLGSAPHVHAWNPSNVFSNKKEKRKKKKRERK